MALSRLETAGNVRALARELGVRRELLHKWRKLYEAGGAEALRTTGRPRPAPEPGSAPELARRAPSSEQRIAELERKLGQQAVEIDFLEGALRRIKASGLPKGGPGATPSSRRSKR